MSRQNRIPLGMRRKLKRSKTVCQKIHAKNRIKERFGFEINKHEYRYLISLIQNNKAQFIKRQSNRTSLFLIKIKNIETVAVYDKIRKTIVTFLPKEWIIEEIDSA